MKVGILVTDHVLPDYAEIAGDYDEMVVSLFDGRGWQFESFDQTLGERPRSLDDCDAYVATGSRASVYDGTPWVMGFQSVVADLYAEGGRYLGICFGSQMMAQALGGEVRRADTGWGVGVKAAEVVSHEPWMVPDAPSYRCVVSHQDQVVRMPDGARVLAANDHCAVSMFMMGDRFLGIQGHPEYSSDYGRALLEARRGKLIPEEVAEAAIPTYDTPIDRDLLAGWLGAFLTGETGSG
jgi:GMP synthase (glutamine-hydrolysing)